MLAPAPQGFGASCFRARWMHCFVFDFMKRIFIIVYLVTSCVLFCHGSSAAPPSSAAFVGIYHVVKFKGDRLSIPTNVFKFSLTLNADGSFVATNVPANLFFSYTPTPAVAEAKGTWKVEHRSEGRSFFYTGENDYLTLNFTSAPGPGSWSNLIYSDLLGPPWMQMDYYLTKSNIFSFKLERLRH